VGYVTVADGRVDLEQWFPPFWERARGVADRARQLRIYAEFDLVDRWIRQHGETDLPQVDPWSARNNIQGIEAGGLAIFRSAPAPIHERWVRKAVAELGEFENVLFQVGNEGFKSFSQAWEVGVYQLVKDELRGHGFSNRLVATNTQDPALESQLDRCVGPGASAPTSCTGEATTTRTSGRARSRNWRPSPPAVAPRLGCVDSGRRQASRALLSAVRVVGSPEPVASWRAS